MLRLRYAGLAALAAVGCSPVKDSSNVPDAPIDGTDMRAPMIESSNPANLATKVSILSPVSVFFDEQLDPASVTNATVKLGYNQNIPTPLFPFVDVLKPHGAGYAGLTPVKGTVSYDTALRKLSFVPSAPLPYGYVFVLSMDGVKDKGGVTFTGTVTFITYVNGMTRQLVINTANQAPIQEIVQPVDMAGRQTRRLVSNSPGVDAVWFTPDDPRNQRHEFNFSPDGRLQDERSFNPGGDGLYDTPDDTVSVCVRYSFNAERQTVERTYASGAGADTMWCTADDLVAANFTYQYMGASLVSWRWDNAPGADNMWHNSDDKCYANWEYQYDAQGNKTREILRYCQADGLPKTVDDTFSYYQDYEYDAAGGQTKMIYHSSPGNDGIWLTGDDPPGYQDRYVRNADGLVTDHYRSNTAGPDTIWGNNDDPGSHTVWIYNEKKLAVETTIYNGIGGDNMWGTNDDTFASYVKTTYDDAGNRVDQKSYAPGLDGVWKNADDRVTLDADFDLAH
jgi:hypothetical protein